MSYPILPLHNESVSEAGAKLHFALATARAKGDAFLRVDFLCGEKERERLCGAVLRVLRERKRNGKIMFFIPSQDFLSSKPEAEFILNKYPEMREDSALLEIDRGYVLVKL